MRPVKEGAAREPRGAVKFPLHAAGRGGHAGSRGPKKSGETSQEGLQGAAEQGNVPSLGQVRSILYAKFLYVPRVWIILCRLPSVIFSDQAKIFLWSY